MLNTAKKTTKTKFLDILEGKKFQKAIYALIVANVLAIILESYEEINGSYNKIFEYFEIFSVVVFTIEYFIRAWVSDINPNSKFSRTNFITSGYGLIDLFAILPFYLPMIFSIDLRMLRMLRLFRLLRVFKLGRYSKSFKTIKSVLKETRSDLAITFFVAFVLLVLSSTLMYYVENEAQPDKFSNIGQSFWWSVATLTTVGYGDVYPITNLGKLFSGIIAIIGIGFVALPTGIISSAFIEKLKDKKESSICPKCGFEHNNQD